MLSDVAKKGNTAHFQQKSLNAPFGARCFLTAFFAMSRDVTHAVSLNAPSGARCFLTPEKKTQPDTQGLNAPFGARCFLTEGKCHPLRQLRVLMHLLALGAFSPW